MGYMYVNKKLYKLVDGAYREFPPSGVRRLLLEEYHFEGVHIGADKLQA